MHNPIFIIPQMGEVSPIPPRRRLCRRRLNKRKAAAAVPVRPGRPAEHNERERAADAGSVARTGTPEREAQATTVKPAAISVIGGIAAAYGVWNKSIFCAGTFVNISAGRSGDRHTCIGIADNIVQAVSVSFWCHFYADIAVVVNQAGSSIPLIAPEFFNVEYLNLRGAVGAGPPELALGVESPRFEQATSVGSASAVPVSEYCLCVGRFAHQDQKRS